MPEFLSKKQWLGGKGIQTLAQVCHKKQKRMNSENIVRAYQSILFYLAVFKLKPEDCVEFKAEINILQVVQLDLK